jgi:hypothetical protein
MGPAHASTRTHPAAPAAPGRPPPSARPLPCPRWLSHPPGPCTALRLPHSPCTQSTAPAQPSTPHRQGPWARRLWASTPPPLGLRLGLTVSAATGRRLATPPPPPPACGASVCGPNIPGPLPPGPLPAPERDAATTLIKGALWVAPGSPLSPLCVPPSRPKAPAARRCNTRGDREVKLPRSLLQAARSRLAAAG